MRGAFKIFKVSLALSISGIYIHSGKVEASPQIVINAPSDLSNEARQVAQSTQSTSPEATPRDVCPSFPYNPIQPSGLQSFAIDETRNILYGLILSGSGTNEKAAIARYKMTRSQPMPASSTSQFSDYVGHQGLSLERLPSGEIKLWSAARHGDGNHHPLAHRQALRFSFPKNGAPIQQIEAYTLFGPEFSYYQNATLPTISYDQKYVIAIGRKKSRDFFVRVFKLKELVEGGPGDYSGLYLFEWPIKVDILESDPRRRLTPIQGVASDGMFVYILAGNSGINDKKLHVYTVDGIRVAQKDDFSPGLTTAGRDGAGKFFEPEGVSITESNYPNRKCIAVLMLSGDAKSRTNRIWSISSP